MNKKYFIGIYIPMNNFLLFQYYFAEKPWLPMADIIVVSYDNGVQLFQRKAIIDLARATDHSITALFSLHILQLLYSMGLRFFGLQRKMPLRRTHQEKVIVYNTLLDRMNINEVNIHIISVFETP